MTEPQSTNFLTRNAAVIFGALVAAVLISLVATLLMVGRVNDTRAELDAIQAELVDTRDEMEQLRGGVALFTSQATLLQNQLGELAPTVTADEIFLAPGL